MSDTSHENRLTLLSGSSCRPHSNAADPVLFSTVRSKPPPIREGYQFGRYRVECCLGSGGMGAVYRALDTVLNRSVAIKTISSRRDNAPLTEGLRFLREAEVIAKLNHPHIVTLHDVGVQGHAPFLVLEHLEGESLETKLAAAQRFNPDEALSLLLPVAAAVAHAHRTGVLHLDLKPANLFVSRDFRGAPLPKVLDFGVCSFSAVEPELDPTRTEHAGTPAYMPPEVLNSAAPRESTDQFALGVILFECLSGVNPFTRAASLPAMRQLMLGGEYPNLDALCPSLPIALRRVVAQAMAPHPDQRFANVSTLGAALASAASPPLRTRWTPEFATDQ